MVVGCRICLVLDRGRTINGIGHPAWSIAQGMYTPGVVAAQMLLALAIYLAIELFRAPRVWRMPRARGSG